jgi:hypothetical protein
MIPQIVSTEICSHPNLDAAQFKAMGRSFPPPAHLLICKCGKNKLCPTCGWNQLAGTCDCDPPPHKLSFHNDGGSGTPVPFVYPRIIYYLEV